MPDAHSQQQTLLGDEIDRLATEIRSRPEQSPEETLDHACTRLALIDPISSAGMFRMDHTGSALEWLYHTQPSSKTIEHSLVRHHDGLSTLLAGGDRVQVDADGGSYFVGLPAGQYDGRAIGLGISSGRALDDDELSHLGSFSLMLGLLAENARLRQQLAQNTEARSTARLIGFIAHELRTPLTGMRGNIQLALMATRKEQFDRIPARLESAISSVDDMSALVQQLLDVSRLERGAFTLNLSEGRLEDTIRRAVQTSETASGNPGVKFTGDSAIRLTGDHDALAKTITFLLKNARAYADHDSPVHITMHEHDHWVGIDLSYSGKSVSGVDLQALSEPLSVARPGSNQQENLSLELAYCRGIISRHGGRIVVRDDRSTSGKHVIEIRLPHSVDS